MKTIYAALSLMLLLGAGSDAGAAAPSAGSPRRYTVNSPETYVAMVNGLTQVERGAANAYQQALDLGYLQCKRAGNRVCVLQRVDDLTTIDHKVVSVREPRFGTYVQIPTEVHHYKYRAIYTGYSSVTLSARVANCDDPQQFEKATREVYKGMYNTPVNFDEDSSVMISDHAIRVSKIEQATEFNQNWCTYEYTKAVSEKP